SATICVGGFNRHSFGCRRHSENRNTEFDGNDGFFWKFHAYPSFLSSSAFLLTRRRLKKPFQKNLRKSPYFCNQWLLCHVFTLIILLKNMNTTNILRKLSTLLSLLLVVVLISCGGKKEEEKEEEEGGTPAAGTATVD